MSRDWQTYLDDILECCRRVRTYAAELDQAGLVANEMAYDAVLRNLEIVGVVEAKLPELEQTVQDFKDAGYA